MTHLQADDVDQIDHLLFDPKLGQIEFSPITVVGSGEQGLLGQPVSDEEALGFSRELVGGESIASLGQWKISVYTRSMLINYVLFDAKSARGFGKNQMPNMGMLQVAKHDGEKWKHVGRVVFGRSGGRMLEIERSRRAVRVASAATVRLVEAAERHTTLISLARRYEWTVRLRVDEGAVVEFMTTSEDARRIFRWRDKPPEAKRRAALRHWVSRVGTAPQGENWYLRGAVDFSWEGVHCKLLPPQFDRERLVERKAGWVATKT